MHSIAFRLSVARTLAVVISLGPSWASAGSPDLQPLLTRIKSVGAEGKGNRDASRAWAELADKSAEHLPQILSSMDDASPLAANWLRAAVDAIAESALDRGAKLPAAELEGFLQNKDHAPKARRLAYELIARVDTTAPDRLIPQMLDDPSLELRRDAVARKIEEGRKMLEKGASGEEAAAQAFQTALSAARELDQVQQCSEALKKLGRAVDLPRHFGFVVDWKLIGPFDNRGGKGYDTAYPPEKKTDFAEDYEGKESRVKWIDHTTADELGNVDLNKALDKHMGAAAYAWCDFVSDRQQPVEIRLGSDNANKVWLNGKLLNQAEVYHTIPTMDQYVGRGALKQGRNEILVKICQNEQTEEWAQEWKFQLRVCDATGTAILSQNRQPSTAGEKRTAANTSGVDR